MPDNNFQTIYDVSDDKEYDKFWLYIMLLEQNERFIKDVEELRKKYDIIVSSEPNAQDTIDNEYADILNNPQFMEDVRVISTNIKLTGNWSNGIAYYVCGAAPQYSLFPDDTNKRIEARPVNNGEESYYELRLYGNFTIADLMEAAKNIRPHMSKSMGYKKVKELDEDVMLKLMLFKQIRKEKSDKDTSEEISTKYTYEPQSYSDLRSQLKTFKSYADRLY